MAKIFKIQQKRVFDAETEPVRSISAPAQVVAAVAPAQERFPELPFKIGEILTEVETDLYDERAAVLEYDAGQDRECAESAAAAEVLAARARGPADILLQDFGCVEIKGALYDSLPKFKDMDENGITRLPNRARETVIREVVAPWDRVLSA